MEGKMRVDFPFFAVRANNFSDGFVINTGDINIRENYDFMSNCMPSPQVMFKHIIKNFDMLKYRSEKRYGKNYLWVKCLNKDKITRNRDDFVVMNMLFVVSFRLLSFADGLKDNIRAIFALDNHKYGIILNVSNADKGFLDKRYYAKVHEAINNLFFLGEADYSYEDENLLFPNPNVRKDGVKLRQYVYVNPLYNAFDVAEVLGIDAQYIPFSIDTSGSKIAKKELKYITRDIKCLYINSGKSHTPTQE